MIEANDVASINLLAGAPFVSGPFINTFNEATIDFLVARGAVQDRAAGRAVGGGDRDAGAPQPGRDRGAGRSAARGCRCRCAAITRAPTGCTRTACQFVCELDPDGLAADQLDGKPLLVVNGTQTLSHGYAAAFDDLAPLQAAGVSHFRLSPQTTDMVKVASAVPRRARRKHRRRPRRRPNSAR